MEHPFAVLRNLWNTLYYGVILSPTFSYSIYNLRIRQVSYRRFRIKNHKIVDDKNEKFAQLFLPWIAATLTGCQNMDSMVFSLRA